MTTTNSSCAAHIAQARGAPGTTPSSQVLGASAVLEYEIAVVALRNIIARRTAQHRPRAALHRALNLLKAEQIRCEVSS